MAGVVWQALQYLIGFRQLGHDVYYVEDYGAPPYDPRVKGLVADPAYNVATLQHALARFDLADRWVYWDSGSDTYFGLSESRVRDLYARADVLVNLCGATTPRAEHRRNGKWIYLRLTLFSNKFAPRRGNDKRLTFLPRTMSASPMVRTSGSPIVLCLWLELTGRRPDRQ